MGSCFYTARKVSTRNYYTQFVSAQEKQQPRQGSGTMLFTGDADRRTWLSRRLQSHRDELGRSESVKVKKLLSHVRLFVTPWTQTQKLALSLWNTPGQNTGVGSLSLLQGIFPTQALNPGLLHCRQILYQLSHQGSPTMECYLAIKQMKFRHLQQHGCYAQRILCLVK